MRRRLFHPWWVDLPCLAAIGAPIAKFAALSPLPSRLAVHFNRAGRPDGWGSAVEAFFAVFIPLGAAFLGSILINEVWARQERGKRFNWFTFILPPYLGFSAAFSWRLMDYWAAGSAGRFGFPWASGLGAALAAGAASALLELLRPAGSGGRPSRRDEDRPGPRVEELIRMMEGGRFVYWESQDPAWLKYVLVIAAAALAVGGGALYGSSRPAAFLYWALALLFFLLYGGLRIAVKGGEIRVGLGVLGLTLYRADLKGISSVEIREFSPLQDFGGWGIRVNAAGTWGFFYRGSRGVLITRRDGRRVLLGSDDPARLAAVIEAARRAEGG